MATAKKLPSGRWRARAYDHTDSAGIRRYKSFTADTKREAVRMAMQWESRPQEDVTEDVTVESAIERYIAAKEGVLSASTIRGYRQMQRTYYEKINRVKVKDLTTERLQIFISDSSKSLGAKSVANIYGLLSSAVTMFRPDGVFRVTLPKKVRKKTPSPSDADVQSLFRMADGELKLCIALAAFGSCRRGEICAIKYQDVKGNAISIHADMILNSKNKYVYKDIPKTSDSLRTIIIPNEVAEMIGDGPHDDFIVKLTPGAVTASFIRLREKAGIDIRFHDLRHYYASIGAVLGVPDIYMSDFGGWRRGSGVMKNVYQSVMTDATDLYASKMTKHFSDLMSDAPAM